MNDLTIATVNFNTPTYLMPFVLSLQKSNAWFNGNINVFDNGETKTIDAGDNGCFFGYHVDKHLYDEFANYVEPNDPGCRHFCSAKHCKTLDYIIKHNKSKYLLICDTDIIFTKNFKTLYDKFVSDNYAVCAYIKQQDSRVPRLAPWFMLVNCDLIKCANVSYYDANRILFVHGNTSFDTGASFLQDCEQKQLKILKLSQDNTYYFHYKGGSYMPPKKVKQWLIDNRKYWSN